MIVVSGWLPMCWIVTLGDSCSTSLICGLPTFWNCSAETYSC